MSYNGSTQSACPNTFIVSSRINWEPYFEYILNCMMNGEDIALDWTGTIATGSVELSAINEQAAAAGTAEKLEEVKAALAAGLESLATACGDLFPAQRGRAGDRALAGTRAGGLLAPYGRDSP